MNYLITFGDDYFKYKKSLLKKEAESTGWFDDITIHSPESISDFLNEHKDFVENSNKGYGYWIWKPYIMLDALEKMNEGDFLFYVDSGASILKSREKRFYEYIEILKNSDKPIITFGELCEFPNYREKYFQKTNVLKRFNLENDETFLNSGQVEAGVFICRKCDFTIKFIQEWLDILVENNYSLVTDEDYFPPSESFIVNRHDQSILSILCKQHNVIFLDLIECYGNGPFFSSRMSDEGPREKAPDGCRREIDFIDGKHLGWKTYLADEEVKERTLSQIKNIFSETRKKLIFGDINFDLRKEFINEIMLELVAIQNGKGMFSIELTINEPSNMKLDKEQLSGSFCGEFNIGDTCCFNFQITSSGITFPENPINFDRMFKNTYYRVWSCA